MQVAIHCLMSRVTTSANCGYVSGRSYAPVFALARKCGRSASCVRHHIDTSHERRHTVDGLTRVLASIMRSAPGARGDSRVTCAATDVGRCGNERQRA